MNRGRSNDIAAVTARVELGSEHARSAFAFYPFRLSEPKLPASWPRSDFEGLRQVHFFGRAIARWPVDIDYEELIEFSGRNSDLRVWILSPPFHELGSVQTRIFKSACAGQRDFLFTGKNTNAVARVGASRLQHRRQHPCRPILSIWESAPKQNFR